MEKSYTRFLVGRELYVIIWKIISLHVFMSCLGCVWSDNGGKEYPKGNSTDGNQLLYIIKNEEFEHTK